jgi:hypothetical protein
VWQDGENIGILEDAVAELEKFGVKYRIIQMESPTPTEEETPNDIEEEVQPSLVQSTPSEEPITPASPKHKLVQSSPFSHKKQQNDDDLLDFLAEKPQKKKFPAFTFSFPAFTLHEKYPAVFNTAVLIIVVVALVIVMFKIPNARERQDSLGAGGSRQSAQNQAGGAVSQTNANSAQGGGGIADRQNAQRAQAEQLAQFNEALDNANSACGNQGVFDMEKAFRFAISFNRQNLRAWLGLLGCFERIGNVQKANEIRLEMREVFGEDVFTIIRIVGFHGTLENLTTQGNACRITYTRTNAHASPEHELFSIATGLAGVNSCRRVIIFAKENLSSGYMISVDFSDLPRTFDAFLERITINRVGF